MKPDENKKQTPQCGADFLRIFGIAESKAREVAEAAQTIARQVEKEEHHVCPAKFIPRMMALYPAGSNEQAYTIYKCGEMFGSMQTVIDTIEQIGKYLPKIKNQDSMPLSGMQFGRKPIKAD